MKWNDFVLLLIGFWLVVSPWILGFSAIDFPTWNSIIFGTFIMILAISNFHGEKIDKNKGQS